MSEEEKAKHLRHQLHRIFESRQRIFSALCCIQLVDEHSREIHINMLKSLANQIKPISWLTQSLTTDKLISNSEKIFKNILEPSCCDSQFLKKLINQMHNETMKNGNEFIRVFN